MVAGSCQRSSNIADAEGAPNAGSALAAKATAPALLARISPKSAPPLPNRFAATAMITETIFFVVEMGPIRTRFYRDHEQGRPRGRARAFPPEAPARQGTRYSENAGYVLPACSRSARASRRAADLTRSPTWPPLPEVTRRPISSASGAYRACFREYWRITPAGWRRSGRRAVAYAIRQTTSGAGDLRGLGVRLSGLLRRRRRPRPAG
jgi:hypothetical protein